MIENTYIESAGISDIGRQRECNEDALIFQDDLGLYAVADGMGGHMHGDVASSVTIDTLLHDVKKFHASEYKGDEQETSYETITDAISNCNKAILQKNVDSDSRVGEGMGTTLAGAYFLKKSMRVITFNVGDSRIYRLRGGAFKQITRDQTMYQEWVDAGEKGLAPAQNILINAVGLVEELTADIRLENVTVGDVYLICSDGLSGLVDDDTLKWFMCEKAMLPAAAMCNQLIDIANKNGGSDNITVIVVRVVEGTRVKPSVIANPQATLQRIKVFKKNVVAVLFGFGLTSGLIQAVSAESDLAPRQTDTSKQAGDVTLPRSNQQSLQTDRLAKELASHLSANSVELNKVLATTSQLLNDREFEQAANQIATARKEYPDMPDLLVRHAEALAGMNNGSLDGEPFEILSQSLDINHRHKPSLWLMAQFNQQINNHEAALIILNALKREMGDDNEFIDVIDRSITMSIMHIDGVEFESLEEK